MGPFLDGSRVMKDHEAGERGDRQGRRAGARLLRASSLPAAGRRPRPLPAALGRRSGGVSTPICSGRPSPTGKTAACSSPAAAPPRRPSTRCAGPARSDRDRRQRKQHRRTEKLKRKYRLDNLEVAPDSRSERAAELGRRFDHVVCTGVLHHLPDPDAGLRALRDVLAPGGALHLMVYAPYGRAGVYMLQDVLPPARHRHDGVGDPRPRREPQGAPAGPPARAPAAQRTRLPGRGRRWPMRSCILRTGLTRCRSCSTSYVTPACSSGAGCGRRRTCLSAARWRPRPISRC